MIGRIRSLDDRQYAWVVVAVSFLMMAIGNGALFLLVVAMKDIAASFGWPRTIPSTAFALLFVGGGLGGIVMGWWLDKAGMGRPAMIGALMIGIGAMLISVVENAWQFFLVYGLVIGPLFGHAAMFTPLVANTTRWFVRKRGIAVGLVTSGQSVAGVVWPPVFEYGLATVGWRDCYLLFGLFGLATMVPLSLMLRRRPGSRGHDSRAASPQDIPDEAPILQIEPRTLMALLCAAIFCCCVSMSLPLGHIRSYATDVGIAPMQAATVLSILLAASFVSRALVSGLLIERIGALRTLFLFSLIQAAAVGLLPFLDGFAVLAVTAAVFGFGYGGIGPAYPVIVRDFLPERWAGRCTGIVILFGTFGMAFGGWVGGAGFDLTGGYGAPFLLGVAFNAVNLAIVAWLISATARPASLVARPA